VTQTFELDFEALRDAGLEPLNPYGWDMRLAADVFGGDEQAQVMQAMVVGTLIRRIVADTGVPATEVEATLKEEATRHLADLERLIRAGGSR
jgi:hypothetical protein